MSFVAEARRRQAKFLAESSTFSERARDANRGVGHAHLLPGGCEIETLYPSLRNEIAAGFFESRSIKWWKGGDESNMAGPTRNLTSSQIACVNFFLPLASSQEALVGVLRALDDDIVSVVPIVYDVPATGARCSSLIELEWVGLLGTLEGAASTRGANVTSADALVLGVTRDGAKRAYLLEWKYCERYPMNESKGEGAAGDKRRSRYSRDYVATDSPFTGAIPIDAMLYEPFYQLMRLGLLGAKMVRERELDVSESRVVVACPAANTAYRDRVTSPHLTAAFPKGTVASVMHGVARDPAMFRVVDQATLGAAALAAGGASVSDWYSYNSQRYGW